jgi:hypothetical protein
MRRRLIYLYHNVHRPLTQAGTLVYHNVHRPPTQAGGGRPLVFALTGLFPANLRCKLAAGRS